MVLGVVALLAVVGLGTIFMGFGGSSSALGSDVHVVQKGDFDISIPASGEFAALNQIEVKNQLETRAVITEIVEEGTHVKKGDVLFRLNDEDVMNQVRNMQNAVDIARNEYQTALADLEIVNKEREAELAKADVAVNLAELALKSWQEGELKSKREELQLAVDTAEKDYARLVERFKASERLREQDFISEDEYRLDEIELLRAKAQLTRAKRDQEVYEEYTREQDEETKKSDLAQAISERDRTKVSYDARVNSAQSKVKTTENQLKSDEERLQIAQRQLGSCVVTAPQDGLVVYASSLDSGGWRDDDNPPQVGTELWRNQTVIVLPDTSRMVAEVKVNEALSGLIKPGQRATITSDARSKSTLTGEVVSIGVLAESGGWRDPNRRDYTVRVRIDGENEGGLKPSMRCKASIHVDRVDDAVFVPVQAVHRIGSVAFVYKPDGDGAAQHKVQVGRSSELYAEITDGLNANDVVLVREPDSNTITVKLDIPKARPGAGMGDGAQLAEGEEPSQDNTRGPGRAGRGGGDRMAGGENRGDGQQGGAKPGDTNGQPERSADSGETTTDGDESDQSASSETPAEPANTAAADQ